MSKSIELRKKSIDVPTAGVRVQLSNVPLIVPWVEFFTPLANGGNIFVGDNTVDSTWIPRDAGVNWTYSASDSGFVSGDYIDLSKIYIDASTAGDDVIVQYPVGL